VLEWVDFRRVDQRCLEFVDSRVFYAQDQLRSSASLEQRHREKAVSFAGVPPTHIYGSANTHEWMR
jgi:hypothetical protein